MGWVKHHINQPQCEFKKVFFANSMNTFSQQATEKNDYFAVINATVVSNMRLEKPHSLSYQLPTLTKRPDTLVKLESYEDDAGSWLKSTETKGASVYCKMPFNGPSDAAAFIMLLISSTLVSRAAMKLKSTKDTLMVGTRIA